MTPVVWRQDAFIFVKPTPDTYEACRTLPGAFYVRTQGVWRYPATPAVAYEVMNALVPGARFDLEVRNLQIRYAKQINRHLNPSPRWPEDVVLTPWDHQREAYEYVQGILGPVDGSAGIFAGMGTGKTLIATALIAARRWRKVLIVCPPNMVDEWAKRLTEYTKPGTIEAFPLKGKLPKRVQTIIEHPARIEYSDPGPSRVFITNYEAVWQHMLGDVILNGTGLDSNWDAVILDESQKIKSAGSKVSQYMSKLGQRVPFRIAMTGTPAHDKVLDVYGQYRFLDPGIFGTNQERFLEAFAVRREVKPGVLAVVRAKNVEDLSERMYRIAFRVSEDILDLPEAVDSTIRLNLRPSAMKQYQILKRDMVLQTPEGVAIAGNPLTMLLRLQQVTSGYLPVVSDDGMETVSKQIDDVKKQALTGLLEDLSHDEPVVVFARFVTDLAQIREAAHATGRMYYEESGRAHEWRSWQESTDRGPTSGDVIGVQLAAGSAGIDLTRAAQVVYFSHGLSLGDYEQSRRRVLRPGQTRHVQYTHLLASGTVDEKVYAALKEKKNMADYVVDELLQA